MKKDQSAVLACVGSVIGAGFASGREIISFFTRYGWHAWWLIALAALTMAGLCLLCMHHARKQGCYTAWYDLMNGRKAAQSCSVFLMVITAGAMVSASGHMAALIWTHPWAYGIGAGGTLLAAWSMGYGSLKPLSLLSALLTLALLCALMAVLASGPARMVYLEGQPGGRTLISAALRAVGYASMNVMLAVGVICRSAAYTQKPPVSAGLFGWLIGILLLLAQCAYSRHPETAQADFPVVVLLSRYGRAGYLLSVGLLYLSVITTLTSVIYAIRTEAEGYIKHNSFRKMFVLGAPLALSCIGFSDIVDRLYAPAGLICLLLVFAPLVLAGAKNRLSQVFLDN